jgi:carbonic anhydrase
MWLRNIKDVHRLYRDEIDALDGEARVNRLIELTVKEQVMNLAKTSIVQRAWKGGNYPHLHGWVYSLTDGIINPIFELEAGTHIDPIYEFGDFQ